MHSGWLLVLDIAGLLALVVGLLVTALLIRRLSVGRSGGVFELSHRLREGRPGRGWVLGVGRYTGESLEWFRVFSLSPRPKRTWDRDEISYEGRRDPSGPEAAALYSDHVVVVCRTPEGEVELAMSESSLMGFQSWLESGPPGTNWDSRPLR